MKKFKVPRTLPFLTILYISMQGCGGSKSDSDTNVILESPLPAVASESGRFIDSAVSSLEYRSGDLVGVTDLSGTFEYETVDGNPQFITFSFNGVELGSALGKPIITPIDLVGNGNLSSPEVQNIARFLQMLDTDGDANNGIAPSMDLLSALLDYLVTWDHVDFSASNFESQPALTQIVADVNAFDVQPHTLPTAELATAHLQQTLACQSSGIYSGEFSGDDHGHFLLWVQHQRIDPISFGDAQPQIGVTSAYVYSRDQARLFGVAPQQGLEFNANNSLVIGKASNGAVFSADLEDYRDITQGYWRNELEGGAGSFTGSRIAGNFAATYRLSGAVGTHNIMDATADNTGAIALDILSGNQISGVLVTSRGDTIPIAGEIEDGVFSQTNDPGLSVNLTVDTSGEHIDNPGVGLFGQPGFWGTWQFQDQQGVIIGTSCKLN